MSPKKKEIPMWAKTGHAKPVTRREFLSAGIIPFAASIAVPNWLSLILGPNAHAAVDMASCPASDPNALIPFVSLNLSGGAAMSANFLPMDAGGQKLSSYSKMGLGDNQVPVEMEFGAPWAGVDNGALLSKFLEGIRSVATGTALTNTAFLAIPCDSQNDTNANKFDVSGAITKAGLVGSFLPNLGRQNTRTGINQAAAIVTPPSPLIVSSYNSLLTSIGYSASLGTALNATQKQSLSKLVSNLNEAQTRKLAMVQSGDQIKKVLDCAGVKNVDVIQKGAGVVDPRQNAQVATAWNINANTGAGTRDLIFASMVYNSLLGQAGVTNLELGGYDYHDNSRNTGNTRDREAGVVVGRILQTAAAMARPVFIYVMSDGSVYSPESTARNAPWEGDRGSNGVAFVFYYRPSARPATSGYQIGSFNNNQAADTKFVTGGNPELAAAAVFANWCKANNRMDIFERVAGRLFDANQLNQVIKVA